MDVRAKDEVKEILQNLLQHPALVDEALESIADTVHRYRLRLQRLSNERREIEAELRETHD